MKWILDLLKELIRYPYCLSCHRSFVHVEESLCASCYQKLHLAETWRWDEGVFYLTPYEGLLHDLLLAYKMKHAYYLRPFFVQILSMRLDKTKAFVLVPASRERLVFEGFDHWALVGKSLRRQGFLIYEPFFRNSGKQQKLLRKDQRQEEIRRTLSWKKSMMAKLPSRVCLLDDISASGYTLRACADLLEEQGFVVEKNYVLLKSLLRNHSALFP